MKEKAIKFIDKNFIRNILRFMSIFYRRQREFRYVDLQNYKKFLLIRPGGIGDATLLLPLLKFLKSKGKEVDVLCMKRNKSVFKVFLELGYLENIYLLEKPGDLIRCAQNKYDCVMDTEQSFSVAVLITKLIRSKLTIGFHMNFRRNFYDYFVIYRQDRYEAQSFLDLLKPFNIRETLNKKDLILKKLKLTVSKNNDFQTSLQNSLAVFVGASMKWRRLDPGFFEEILDKVSKKFSKIFIIGGKDGEEVSKILGKKYNNVVNLCGQTSIRETLFLLQNSQAFIGSDSGPLHLAVLAGVPKIVAIFGPGVDTKWGYPNLMLILKNDLPCNPCSYGNFSQPVFCPFIEEHFKNIDVGPAITFLSK